MHLRGTKVWSGHVLPTQKLPLTTFCTLPSLYHACTTVSLFFLKVAFHDLLTFGGASESFEGVLVNFCINIELCLERLTGIKQALG